MKALFTLLFISAYSTLLMGQFPKSASCTDAEFDKKVNSYLSYAAPVISVTTARNQQDKFIFLDAREAEEYKVSHIPGARHIGYDKFDISKLKDLPQDSKLVVYCSIGYRSEKIAAKLRKAGFKNSYNLYGSIFEWANLGYPLHDQYAKETPRVHTYNKSWSRWVQNPKIEKVW